MSKPRERHPGAVYFVTRRTHRREFRLRPGDEMNGAIGVVVNDACLATGVEIIAFVAMSNHYHAVVHDPAGRLSDWLAHVDGVLARFCNHVQETRSHVWDAQEGHEIRLEGVGVIAAKVAYVLANPVAAGLVYAPSAWPGVITRLKDVGTGMGKFYRRPERFFRTEGPVSEWGEVQSHAPPGASPEHFRALVKAQLDEALGTARARVAESGRGFLGATAVMEQDVFASAVAPERAQAGLKVTAFRRFIAATPERTAELVEGHQVFLDDYAHALYRLRTQRPDVVFPAGTFKVWRCFGAEREPPLDLQAA